MQPPSLRAWAQFAGVPKLPVIVFGYEYCPASESADGAHANLVFSRTGVARYRDRSTALQHREPRLLTRGRKQHPRFSGDSPPGFLLGCQTLGRRASKGRGFERRESHCRRTAAEQKSSTSQWPWAGYFPRRRRRDSSPAPQMCACSSPSGSLLLRSAWCPGCRFGCSARKPLSQVCAGLTTWMRAISLTIDCAAVSS